MKYAFIREQRKHHSLVRMLSVLDVSRSGYHDWLGRAESARTVANRRLLSKIKAFHLASRKIYGSPRIHLDLVESGESVGVNRVARLMRENKIQSKVAKKFIVTTDWHIFIEIKISDIS